MEKKSYGICLGASTISAVEVIKTKNNFKITKIIRKEHEGNPKKVYEEVLKELNTGDYPVLVTGRRFRNFVNIPNITEAEAVETALKYIAKKDDKYDVLVSAGGETFIVYRLDDDLRIVGISTGNKCASGTGEFFMQQIKRMALTLDSAMEIAESGEPYRVSGRCSVFCKSDCTHALNKGVPVANVTAGLCKMIAEKVIELVKKIPHKKVIVTGGLTLNKKVIKYIIQEIKNLVVPEEAPYFEALGTAILGFEKGEKVRDVLFKEGETSFPRLAPLKQAETLVTFCESKRGDFNSYNRCIIGLDVGSTTTKAVLVRTDDDAILSSVYLRTNGNPIEASRKCYEAIYNSVKDKNVEIIGIGITGSGRQIAGLFTLTDGIINEIIAHATASVYFDPDVDTIFEIGGQDAKYTHITNGVASDYAMNEACSAGTGSFLEEAAKESLNIDYRDIAELALQAEEPPNFNDQCAAFISSDIKNATHEGISQNDILAGLVYSICFNYANRVKGHRQVGNKIFMQGGVCYNKAVPLAMASIINKPIIVPPEPGLMGAFGVALELKKRINLGLIKEQKFDLKEIIERKVIYEKPFICAGGKEKCDLKCNINMIRIGDKVFPFGGACNRYYNIRYNIDVDAQKIDYVKIRNELAFTKYCPPLQVKPGAPTIGINKSFITYQVFPLYYNFFRNLGCDIIVPDRINEKSIYRQTTSFCFPAQVALGLFDNLSDKKPDFYFIPHTEEMYVARGNNRKEFSSTCIFVQGEAFWMAQIFKDKISKEKVIAPTLNFRNGYEKEKDKFIEIGKKLGFNKKEIVRAFENAVALQYQYRQEKKDIGKKFLEELHKDPSKVAIVLFGPPHNALSDDTNKGIPKKVSSRGYAIIPFDLLPSDNEVIEEPHDDYMHWEIGQKIIRASQMVKKDKQLFGLYITNFLCAMDSLLVTYFRRIMKEKPNLTIEIDGHTADAGIDTRIEAFIDVIKNYLEIKTSSQIKTQVDFKPARILIEKSGMFFIDSNGEKISLKDPRIKMIMPSMGDISTELFAATLRKSGINAQWTGVSDKETLQIGRSVTTGKECLPMILCVGSMLKYLKHRKTKDEKLIVFQPRAAGYCRLGQYHVFMNMLIRERKIRDVALLSLANEEKYAGLGTDFTINAWKAIVAGDVLDDIRNALWAIAQDVKYAENIFNQEIKKLVSSLEGTSSADFYQQLRLTSKRLRQIPLKITLEEAPEIAVMGEIFVRRDSFSNKDIARRLAQRGFIARISHISEWIYYLSYMINNKLHIPNYTFWGWIEFYISDVIQRKIEKEIKDILSESGLYKTELVDIEDIIKYSKHILPHNLKGEPGMILGTMMRDIFTKYAGIINIGPFSCMPVRFTESIANNILDMKSKMDAYKYAGIHIKENGFKEKDRIPFLTVEVDGNPWTQIIEARFESFCLQASRVAERQGRKVLKTSV